MMLVMMRMRMRMGKILLLLAVYVCTYLFSKFAITSFFL